MFHFSSANQSESSQSPLSVDIDEDASKDMEDSFVNTSFTSFNFTPDEKILPEHCSKPKSIREERLIAVSQLFQICYRTVIPNRPPMLVNSDTNFPIPLGSLNPRPMGASRRCFLGFD